MPKCIVCPDLYAQNEKEMFMKDGKRWKNERLKLDVEVLTTLCDINASFGKQAMTASS